MPALSIILSCYIFLLAFLPCSDEPVPDISQDQSRWAVAQHDAHQHSEAGSDFCTPFCHCHCCHSHVTFFVTPDSAHLFFGLSESQAAYSFLPEHQFLPFVFQPPRG